MGIADITIKMSTMLAFLCMLLMASVFFFFLPLIEFPEPYRPEPIYIVLPVTDSEQPTYNMYKQFEEEDFTYEESPY